MDIGKILSRELTSKYLEYVAFEHYLLVLFFSGHRIYQRSIYYQKHAIGPGYKLRHEQIP